MKTFFSSPRFIFGLVWILTAALFFWGWSATFFAGRERMHEIKAPTADGVAVRPLTAAQLKAAIVSDGSKLTVVNIWATWCEPCGREMPVFAQMHEKFARSGVSIRLVSADEKEDQEEVRKFLVEKGILFETFILDESAGAFMKEIQPTWSGALPATFLFKPDGRMHSFFLGEISAEQLDKKIEGALSAN